MVGKDGSRTENFLLENQGSSPQIKKRKWSGIAILESLSKIISEFLCLLKLLND